MDINSANFSAVNASQFSNIEQRDLNSQSFTSNLSVAQGNAEAADLSAHTYLANNAALMQSRELSDSNTVSVSLNIGLALSNNELADGSSAVLASINSANLNNLELLDSHVSQVSVGVSAIIVSVDNVEQKDFNAALASALISAVQTVTESNDLAQMTLNVSASALAQSFELVDTNRIVVNVALDAILVNSQNIESPDLARLISFVGIITTDLPSGYSQTIRDVTIERTANAQLGARQNTAYELRVNIETGFRQNTQIGKRKNGH